mgnify:CR=1 FL=1
MYMFPSGYFKIRSKLTGKCLSIKNNNTGTGGSLVMTACHAGLNQQWYVDGAGRVFSKLNSLTIEVRSSNKANGAKVHTAAPSGAASQRWSVDTLGRINSKLSGKSLTFDEGNKGTAPVYQWDNYNGPSQKWYFEEIDDSADSPDSTPRVNLAKIYAGTSGVKKIAGQQVLPSAEFTYQMWIKLTKFEKTSNWKVVFTKSHSEKDTSDRSPGLWILPGEPKFHVRCNTTKGKDGVLKTIDYTIPTGIWINIALVFKSRSVDFYVNGDSKGRIPVDGWINPNASDIWLGRDNKNLFIRDMEYTNRALSKKELDAGRSGVNPNKVVNGVITSPVREDVFHHGKELGIMGEAGEMGETSKQGVTIVRLTSNGSHKDCPVYNSRVGQKGWCAKKKTRGFYLEAHLDKIYRIDQLMTQGRSDSNQWVTVFQVKYLDQDGKWQWFKATGRKEPRKFQGNSDNHTIKIHNLNGAGKAGALVSDRVRIYPLQWNQWPSLRVGFNGKPASQSKCEDYKDQSVRADTDKERQKYLKLYNQECRTVTYYNHIQKLTAEKDKYEKLYTILKTTRANSRETRAESAKLNAHIKKLKSALKTAELDLELSKHKKCPPIPKCLPIIANPVAPMNLPSSHVRIGTPDVKGVTGIKGISKAEEACGAEEECGERKTLGPTPTIPKPSLSPKPLLASKGSCEAMFKGGMSQQGGANYLQSNNIMFGGARKCNVGTVDHPYQEEAPTLEDNTEDRYNVRNHKDFKKVLKDYKCTLATKAPVTTHAPTQAPSVPSTTIYDKITSKCGNIKDHPQYKELMNKYARVDKSTCPSGYLPCDDIRADIRKHPDFAKYVSVDSAKEAVHKVKDECNSHFNSKFRAIPIEKHPDFDKYVLKSEVKDTLEKARKAQHSPNNSIKQHPQYKALMNKYALVDNSTCPPTYKPATSGSGVEANRQNDLLRRQLKDMNFKTSKAVQVIQKQRADLDKLRSRPISEHPQYKALMNKYTTVDHSTCPPTYHPCKTARDINQHPDIHKYILKSQLPDLLDRECRKHFRK